jgi:uncharacterized protein (TIGR02147 family)
MKPDIFRYNNHRAYLKDMYDFLKKSNKGFSYRVFARMAGIKSYNYLKLVIDGKRNLTQKMIQAFSKAFKLTRSEEEFLTNLALFNQSRDSSSKNEYFGRISKAKRFREIKELEADQYEYFSKWYFSAIRELISLPDFKEDSDWIVARLRGEVTVSQVDAAIECLLRLKLIERTSAGRLKPSSGNIASAPEVQSLALFSFHEQMIHLGLNALHQQEADLRDISSITLALSKDEIKAIKKMILQFRRKTLSHFETQRPKGCQVFQLNFQLFPLSEGS